MTCLTDACIRIRGELVKQGRVIFPKHFVKQLGGRPVLIRHHQGKIMQGGRASLPGVHHDATMQDKS